MNKRAKKIISLVLAIMMLAVYFALGASAATDINGSKCDFTYSTVDKTATLTKSSNTSQSWKLPSSVSCKVGSSYPYFTVTKISSAFLANSTNAKYVTYLRLPSSLTEIPNGLFNSNANYLKTLEIYGANTTCNDYFIGCTALEEFVVNENNTNIKAVDGILFDYDGATLMKFPAAKALTDTTVYEVPEGTTAIRSYAFYKAKNITEVYVPASVETIGSGAFCDSTITAVHFENGSAYDFSAYTCKCNNCAEKLKFCLEDAESIEATCSQEGHTEGIRCDITGEWFSGEVIPQLDHDFSGAPTQSNPTCTENVFRIFTCTYGCGATDKQELQGTSLGHSGGTATCTSAAVCTTCNNSYGNIDANNHSFTKYTYNNNATCENDGTKFASCDYGCGKINTVVATNTKKGHSFTIYNKSADAACGKNAKETAACDNNCGKKDTREIAGTALSHSASDVVVSNNVAPTCESNGSYVETVTCTKCSTVLRTETKTVPALGHADTDGDKVCDNGGEALRSPEDDCTHMCHKSGFMGFIWKIVLFFQKLFKANPVCECGVAHY